MSGINATVALYTFTDTFMAGRLVLSGIVFVMLEWTLLVA
jgi:hypothetical protein